MEEVQEQPLDQEVQEQQLDQNNTKNDTSQHYEKRRRLHVELGSIYRSY